MVGVGQMWVMPGGDEYEKRNDVYLLARTASRCFAVRLRFGCNLHQTTFMPSRDMTTPSSPQNAVWFMYITMTTVAPQ
jgi:hypothetical protein